MTTRNRVDSPVTAWYWLVVCLCVLCWTLVVVVADMWIRHSELQTEITNLRYRLVDIQRRQIPWELTPGSQKPAQEQ